MMKLYENVKAICDSKKMSIRIKKAKSEVAEKIRSFAQKFDTMFNQINDKEQ